MNLGSATNNLRQKKIRSEAFLYFFYAVKVRCSEIMTEQLGDWDPWRQGSNVSRVVVSSRLFHDSYYSGFAANFSLFFSIFGLIRQCRVPVVNLKKVLCLMSQNTIIFRVYTCPVTRTLKTSESGDENEFVDESDPTSYEATKAITNKAQKKFWGSNGIQTHDLCDTSAMLYQLSYEASLEAGQKRVQFIPIICFKVTA